MRIILYILPFLFVLSACKKEAAEYWDVLNCYMIVNNTDDIVVLRLNYPRLTNKELQPHDTFKSLMEIAEGEQGKAYKSPFFYADTCILTINNVEYCYSKSDLVVGNPLIFENYRIEKKSDFYFNMYFEIEDSKYD